MTDLTNELRDAIREVEIRRRALRVAMWRLARLLPPPLTGEAETEDKSGARRPLPRRDLALR
jgi:hypothetical protein